MYCVPNSVCLCLKLMGLPHNKEVIRQECNIAMDERGEGACEEDMLAVFSKYLPNYTEVESITNESLIHIVEPPMDDHCFVWFDGFRLEMGAFEETCGLGNIPLAAKDVAGTIWEVGPPEQSRSAAKA